MKNYDMMAFGGKNGNNSRNAPDGKKRIVTIKNNYERMASS